ncbi:hypothetical protein GCM10019997_05620 [Prevotella corporis]
MGYNHCQSITVTAAKLIAEAVEFSGLATMVRIVLMEYLNMNNFFNMPDADMKLMLEAAAESPPEVTENE